MPKPTVCLGAKAKGYTLCVIDWGSTALQLNPRVTILFSWPVNGVTIFMTQSSEFNKYLPANVTFPCQLEEADILIGFVKTDIYVESGLGL